VNGDNSFYTREQQEAIDEQAFSFRDRERRIDCRVKKAVATAEAENEKLRAKLARIEAALEDDEMMCQLEAEAIDRSYEEAPFGMAECLGLLRTRLREIVQEAAPEARSGDESPQGGKAPAGPDNGSGGAESATVGPFEGSGGAE